VEANKADSPEAEAVDKAPAVVALETVNRFE
jgi:hypothetical protein